MSSNEPIATTDLRRRFELVDQSTLNAEQVVRKNIGFWSDAWRRFRQNKVAMFFAAILLVLIVLAIFGPAISGKDYITINGMEKNIAPCSEYWFGTDNMGRDMFARSWVALRTSLIIALVSAVIQLVIGCVYGAIMGSVGGVVDEVMMRIVEVFSCVPNLILVTLLLVVFGNGYPQLLLALSVSSWTGTARLVRGQVFKLRESEYVMAATALGGGRMHNIVKHLLPVDPRNGTGHPERHLLGDVPVLLGHRPAAPEFLLGFHARNRPVLYDFLSLSARHSVRAAGFDCAVV